MSSEIKRYGVGARMSEGVSYNGIIWLAGQVGNPGDSVEDQTRTCLAEVDRILAEAGTDKTKLLTAMIYVSDFSAKAEMNKAWTAWIAGHDLPTRATIGVDTLGEGCLVEIVISAAV